MKTKKQLQEKLERYNEIRRKSRKQIAITKKSLKLAGQINDFISEFSSGHLLASYTQLQKLVAQLKKINLKQVK